MPNEPIITYKYGIALMFRPLSLYEDDKEFQINMENPLATSSNTDFPAFQDIISDMHLKSPKDEGEMDVEPKHQSSEVPTHSSRTAGKLKSSDSAEKRARIWHGN